MPSDKTNLAVILAAALSVLTSLAVGWYVRTSGDPSARVNEYNAIVAELEAPVLRAETTPGWPLIDEDGAALLESAANDPACTPHFDPDLGLIDATRAVRLFPERPVPSALRAAIADCTPAMEKLTRATHTRTIRSPRHVLRPADDAHKLRLGRLGEIMAADAYLRRDGVALVTIARAGDDFARGGTLIEAMLGNYTSENAILFLKAALERGELPASSFPEIRAELSHLHRAYSGFGPTWRTEAVDLMCGEWVDDEARPLARCGKFIPPEKVPEWLGPVTGDVLESIWDERMAYREVEAAPWPVRRAWWAASGERVNALYNPISRVVANTSVFGRYDLAAAQRRSIEGLVLTALGEPGVVDPLTGKPYRVESTPEGKVITSAAVEDLGAFVDPDEVLPSHLTLALPTVAPDAP